MRRHGFGIRTDRELSLTNALGSALPDCKNLLCVWHINKNVTAKQKNAQILHGERGTYQVGWNEACYARTGEGFDEVWTELEATCAELPRGMSLMSYF